MHIGDTVTTPSGKNGLIIAIKDDIAHIKLDNGIIEYWSIDDLLDY